MLQGKSYLNNILVNFNFHELGYTESGSVETDNRCLVCVLFNRHALAFFALVLWLVSSTFSASVFADSRYQVSASDFSLMNNDNESTLLQTPQYAWISEKLDFKPHSKASGDSLATGAEVWTRNRWGISGHFSKNDSDLFGLPKYSEFRGINFNRQLFRSKDKLDYLALGIGWQDIRIQDAVCLLYTSPSPRDKRQSRMPSSA